MTPRPALRRLKVLLFSAFLVVMGAGWGAAQSLGKIAVDTGYGSFGVLVWQNIPGAALMAVLCRPDTSPLPSAISLCAPANGNAHFTARRLPGLRFGVYPAQPRTKAPLADGPLVGNT
ncbi:hypothetical protein ABMC88_05580 [Sulfitobacter sp. HNIBRBA2951]|uniref:hypothetical protein n=1 Tax=Sulfitobacter aquimarinus TaxID=3158557 RepID=UPI0032E007E8